VREKIYKYLLAAGEGVGSDRILHEVCHILSPNELTAEKVVAGILGKDERFVRIRGLWHLKPASITPDRIDPAHSVTLHIRTADPSGDGPAVNGAVRRGNGVIREFASSSPINILRRIRSDMEGLLLVLWSRRELQLWNGLLRAKSLRSCNGETLFLRNLAAPVLKRSAARLQPADLVQALGLSPPDEENPRREAQYLHACWLALLDGVPVGKSGNLESLREWIEMSHSRIDFSRFEFDRRFLRQLPPEPGLYIMKNRGGSILYVGKSGNLRRRVSSYFTPGALTHPKTARIHQNLYSIDVSATENEIESLLLEMRLIKDFHPPINLQTEIHETAATYTKERNLLFFVVNADRERVWIYFLRGGIFAGRQSAPLRRPPSKRLSQKIKSLFFSGRSHKKPAGESWEKQIVARWFAANRKRLNYLDVDEAGDYPAVLERLRDYLCDPDRLFRKVFFVRGTVTSVPGGHW
jgi:hypothetical protein